MKVFLDTNVLVSAVATRGLCGDVVREILTRHEPFISKQVLTELRRVLHTKLELPKDVVANFLDLLCDSCTVAKPGTPPKIELRDASDVKIVAAAIAAGADILVTGDAELLTLGQCQETAILSPRQFWERLTGDSDQT